MEGFQLDVVHSSNGCVAREPIPHGTLILVESPSFRLFVDSDDNTINTRMQGLNIRNLRFIGSLCTNGDPIIEQNRPPNAPIPSDVLVKLFKCYQLRCGTLPRREQKKDAAAFGLFLEACKIKRSCQPNLHGHWSDGKMYFRAMKDIAKGEELRLSSDIQGILYSRDERHERLWSRHGFECSCSTPDPKSQKESDERRGFIKYVIDQVHSNVETSDNVGLEEINLALAYMEQEGILHFRDTLCYARFKLYQDLEIRDDRILFRYLQETGEWTRATVGMEDRRYKDISEGLKLLNPNTRQ